MKFEHKTVFMGLGTYAGWPANHGSWQWGNEFLVGFMMGGYSKYAPMHHIAEPFRKVLARSLDGGETWDVEHPHVDFEAKTVGPAPPFEMSENIIRVCGNYDTGGEHCASEGGFYISPDRGKTWDGAYAFTGLDHIFKTKDNWNTSRTRVMGSMIFLSVANYKHWGSDSTLCVTHDGKQFNLHGMVCNDDHRAVMPATTRIDNTLFAALRRKGKGQNWIELFISSDFGKSWRSLSTVADTMSHNGNPPALEAVKGKLYCAFAVRPHKQMVLATSNNLGYTWNYEVFRTGKTTDIGYPQLFTRKDGKLVCVYYWADTTDEPQRIEATVITP